MIIRQFETGACIVYINNEWVPVFAGGVSGGASSSESSSASGLRKTPQFGSFTLGYANQANAANTFSQQAANSPFGYFQGQHVSHLVPTNSMGLPTQLNQALEGFGNSMFSKASAGGAFRGQINPENTQGIVGSSLQNIGQFLTPYIIDFSKYLTGLPDQLNANRLGYLTSTLAAQAPGLGSESQSESSSAQGGIFN